MTEPNGGSAEYKGLKLKANLAVWILLVMSALLALVIWIAATGDDRIVELLHEIRDRLPPPSGR